VIIVEHNDGWLELNDGNGYWVDIPPDGHKWLNDGLMESTQVQVMIKWILRQPIRSGCDD